jgi:ligand-binding sensor domain-containing protein
VPDIFEDHMGNLWISTLDGLDKFDPKTKTFTTYTTEQGLPGNIIYAVREDDSQKIWISTNHGLSEYDPLSGKFKNFTTEDGLQDDEFKPHSALKASDGRLYFGGSLRSRYLINHLPMQQRMEMSPVCIKIFPIQGSSV